MRIVPRHAAGWLAFVLAVPILASVLALGSSTVPAGALTNCTADPSLDGEETAFLTTINAYRAQNGLAALALSTNLNRAAAWLAGDLGSKNYFSHADSLGRDPSTRALNCGYPQGAAENIAAGVGTAQSAFNLWKGSAGHNANMLNASYRQIGIARAYASGSTYGWYWVTDFGTTNDGSGGGTGGGSTSTPPPTTTPPPQATATKASITSPPPGSTLGGSTVTFTWNSGAGAQEYFLYAGTSAGANDLYAASLGLGRSATVSSLPTNGSTISVRLWTRLAAGWQYNDYTFRAATASTPTQPAGGTTPTLSAPPPGSTIHGNTVTFTWTAVTGALEYFFYAGSQPGGNDLAAQPTGSSTSATATRLPASNATVYIRLWWRAADGWHFADTTVISAP